ncbi:MAG: nucleotide exchange factor GrpE [Clostridia bacterium]|nr:nucleotide exchange factor GrpE [Clostridia bacterium]
MKIKFKEKVKSGIKQILAELQKMLDMMTHSKSVENKHFEMLTSRLDSMEKQTADSIARISAQINRIDEMIQKESGNDMKDLSPAVLSLNEELRSQQEDLLQQLNTVRDTIVNTPKSEAETSELSSQLSKIGTSVNRHNMVIEDLIEAMEDAQKQQKNTLAKMEELTSREESAEVASLKASEASLFKLVQVYQDQLNVLERAAEGDPSWSRQFGFVRQKVASQLQVSGITIIEQTGIPVNYELHEVIDRVSTDDQALNQCVAEIFESGYIFKGTVKRKARISAYLWSNPDAVTTGVPTGSVPNNIIHLGPAPVQPSAWTAQPLSDSPFSAPSEPHISAFASIPADAEAEPLETPVSEYAEAPVDTEAETFETPVPGFVETPADAEDEGLEVPAFDVVETPVDTEAEALEVPAFDVAETPVDTEAESFEAPVSEFAETPVGAEDESFETPFPEFAKTPVGAEDESLDAPVFEVTETPVDTEAESFETPVPEFAEAPADAEDEALEVPAFEVAETPVDTEAESFEAPVFEFAEAPVDDDDEAFEAPASDVAEALMDEDEALEAPVFEVPETQVGAEDDVFESPISEVAEALMDEDEILETPAYDVAEAPVDGEDENLEVPADEDESMEVPSPEDAAVLSDDDAASFDASDDDSWIDMIPVADVPSEASSVETPDVSGSEPDVSPTTRGFDDELDDDGSENEENETFNRSSSDNPYPQNSSDTNRNGSRFWD